MKWLLTQYNVIVYGDTDDPIFRSSSGRSSFPFNRLFEYTEQESQDRYKTNLASLSELPTLVLSEVTRRQQAPAFLIRISGLTRIGSNVEFRFERLLGSFSSNEIFECRYFDSISTSERSRTHWAVKTGNLLEILAELEKDQVSDRTPTLFNVREWPLPVLGHVAVMMPFQQELYPVYEAIKAACDNQFLQTRRVDEIYGHKPIIDDVFATIAQSQLVISDLTDRNPNVLYETGIAHTLDCDVIIITQNSEDIPFD